MAVQEKFRCDFDYIALLDSFSNDPYLVFLDSSDPNSSSSIFSYIGFDPFLTLTVKRDVTLIHYRGGDTFSLKGNPLDIIQTYLSKYHDPTLLPFTAGAIGSFSYESARFLEDFKFIRPSLVEHEITLGFYDKVLVYHHPSQECNLYFTRFLDLNNQFSFHDFHNKVSMTVDQSEDYDIGDFSLDIALDDYSKKVDCIKRYISRGDIYQANLTYRSSVLFSGSSVALYKSLRTHSPAPYSAFLNSGFGTIFSSSPEQLLTLEKDILATRPIKGTISRGQTIEEDKVQKERLRHSEKDKAELLMIIDLERNDLSKVCVPGSVEVTQLIGLESYHYLHHLVSTISGRLKTGLTALEAFKAVFPGGSITGAPKIRSTEIIQDLEETSRNSYTGSIGFFSFDGSLKCNVAIRTMYVLGNRLCFHVGGGIVSDSDSESEWQETIIKAKGMLSALRQTERVYL